MAVDLYNSYSKVFEPAGTHSSKKTDISAL